MAAHGATPETANAFDDDATTRWTTGAAQQPGQSLVADLDRARTVDRLVLDTGVDRGDFPRGYTVSASGDGTRARFLRVTQTASAPQWWSVAEVRVYR